MRRAPLVVCGAFALALVAGACGNGDEDTADEAPPTEPPSEPTPTEPPAPDPAPGPLDEVAVALAPVADVADPTAFAIRDGDPTLYVTEQAGRVLGVRDGAVSTVLDLTDEVRVDREQGLLGITFSPDGSLLYVSSSDLDGDTRIDEFAVGDDGVDLEARRTILEVDQPRANHNGGQVTYGPDGMLWIGLGDGGGAGDPEDQAQALDSLLGAMVRIDPTGGDPYAIPADNPFVEGGGAPEIWSYGLRNPWRFSFDADSGDLWIADVGQNAWEEINFAPAPELGRGFNWGWPHREGTHDFRGGGPDDLVDPIFEYPNPAEGCSISGGYVYRGGAIPELDGAYVYSDFCNSTLRAVRVDGGAVVDHATLPAESQGVTSFGQGPDGELYVLSQGEGLQRLEPA